MTVNRGTAFIIIGVVYTISVIIHLMAATLFEPGGVLYRGAVSAEHFNGEYLAEQWYDVLVIWAPVLSVAGVTMWGIVNEYRRQTQTALSNVSRRR